MNWLKLPSGRFVNLDLIGLVGKTGDEQLDVYFSGDGGDYSLNCDGPDASYLLAALDRLAGEGGESKWCARCGHSRNAHPADGGCMAGSFKNPCLCEGFSVRSMTTDSTVAPPTEPARGGQSGADTSPSPRQAAKATPGTGRGGGDTCAARAPAATAPEAGSGSTAMPHKRNPLPGERAGVGVVVRKWPLRGPEPFCALVELDGIVPTIAALAHEHNAVVARVRELEAANEAQTKLLHRKSERQRETSAELALARREAKEATSAVREWYDLYGCAEDNCASSLCNRTRALLSRNPPSPPGGEKLRCRHCGCPGRNHDKSYGLCTCGECRGYESRVRPAAGEQRKERP